MFKQYKEVEMDDSAYIAGYEGGIEAGRMEVVDWIESCKDLPTYSICEGTKVRISEPPSKLVLIREWKDKLKEWGIECV